MATKNYRAWDKKNDHMILSTNRMFYPTSAGVLWLDPTREENYYKILPAERFELMEGTGKKDKSGTEVFGGDIIEFDKEEWRFEGNIHIVSWDTEGACWDFGGGTANDMHFRKVIGNIHATPHLIPEKPTNRFPKPDGPEY